MLRVVRQVGRALPADRVRPARDCRLTRTEPDCASFVAVRELQQYVAETADRLGLHATPATLLLDLQARVGALADEVVRATEHGRRPFRPTRDWESLLGDVTFALVTLADQTGVDADRAVRVAADQMYRSAVAQQRQQPAAEPWPFSG